MGNCGGDFGLAGLVVFAQWVKSWKIPIGMLVVLSLRCQDILLKFLTEKLAMVKINSFLKIISHRFMVEDVGRCGSVFLV